MRARAFIAATIASAALVLLTATALATTQGDIDGNGVVDSADMALFFAAWRNCAAGQTWDHAADLNGDNKLDHADAVLMVDAYIAATTVDPRALLIKAEGDMDAGLLSQAADELGVVMIAEPTWARPVGDLGVVRQLQGQADEAEQEYVSFATIWRTQQGAPVSPECDRDGRFYRLLNGARMDNSLAPLKPDARLALAAWWHSTYMETNSTVTHYEYDNPGYVQPIDRMRLALGWYLNNYMAENVGGVWGSASSTYQAAVDFLHDGFMNSAPHKANILATYAYSLGIAVALGPTSMYVTEDFAVLPAGGVISGMEPASVAKTVVSLSGPLELQR